MFPGADAPVCAVGDFSDGECLVVDLLDLGAYPHRASALSVVVARHIYGASCGEVRVQRELLTLEVGYRRIDYLVEIMGKNL